MKRSVLALAVASIGASSFAQREVGEVRRMTIPANAFAERVNDTIYSANMFNGNAYTYGITDQDGYIFGTNDYGDRSKAQAFILAGPTVAKEVLVWSGAKSVADGSNSTLSFRVWDMTGPGSLLNDQTTQDAPNNVLAEISIPLNDADTCLNLCFTVAQFDQPTAIPDYVAVGFNMEGITAGDGYSIVASESGYVDQEEFSWEQWANGTWHSIASAWGSASTPLQSDMFVFLVIDDEMVGVNEAVTMNGIGLRFLNGNPFNGDALQVAYDLEKASSVRAMVIDATGRTLVNEQLGNRANGQHNIEFNTAGWGAGQYYVTIIADGRPVTRKVTKL